MTIGERIKTRRIELGYSQEDLAQKLGYKSRSTINKIELGINDITELKIQSFAKALLTTPSYLMGFTDDPYDYRLDSEHRLDDIPAGDIETYKSIYHGDPELMWKGWRQVEEVVEKAVKEVLQQAVTDGLIKPKEKRPSAEDERILEALQGNKRLRDFIEQFLALPEERQLLALNAALPLVQFLQLREHN